MNRGVSLGKAIMIFKPPKNYHKLISKLSLVTFFTTLIFLLVLTKLGYIPVLNLTDKSVIPPSEKYDKLIEWLLSFGLVPLIGALVVYFISSAFELHNKVSKLIGVRYLWDRFFIAKILVERAGASEELNRKRVKDIMYKLYYPGLKEIDAHFTLIFWKYAYHFWVIFEHAVIVLLTTLIISRYHHEWDLLYLWLYSFAVILLAALQLIFITGQKSKDQANQIPQEKLNQFFRLFVS